MRKSPGGVLALAVVTAATLAFGGPASAEPKVEPGKPYPSQAEVQRARDFMKTRAELVGRIEQARADAQRRLQEAQLAAGVAVERYNGARLEARLAKEAAAKAEREATAARRKVESQRDGIAMLAAQSYSEGAALNGIHTLMGAKDPAALMTRDGVAQSAGTAMKLRYDEFAIASEDAVRAEKAAAKAKARSARLAREAETARSVAEFSTLGAAHAQGNAGAVAATLHADLAKAEEAVRELEKQRKAALEALEDEDPANDPGPERPLPPAPKAPPPPTLHRGTTDATERVIPRSYPGPTAKAPQRDKAAVQRVIDFAMAQLGEPYVWAAAGPDAWDCSGFTMEAWKQGGVSLPHYSEAQYLTSTPISAADLAPGDLIFWQGRQERINHVAMYIGGGEMIHASGDKQRVNVTPMDDFIPPDYFARPTLAGS